MKQNGAQYFEQIDDVKKLFKDFILTFYFLDEKGVPDSKFKVF